MSDCSDLQSRFCNERFAEINKKLDGLGTTLIDIKANDLAHINARVAVMGEQIKQIRKSKSRSFNGIGRREYTIIAAMMGLITLLVKFLIF